MLYEFDVRFQTKVGKSNLLCFTDSTKHSSAGCYSSTTDNLLNFYTNKIEQHPTDINFFVTYWALIKYQALLTIQAKPKLAIILFYFSVEIDSGEILASVWQEEGNLEVLKRCYIQIYPTSFLQCKRK